MTPAGRPGPGRYAGRHVLVAGAGVSGVPVAEALLAAGAAVTVTDRSESAALGRLEDAGARVVLDARQLPAGVDEVVTSPGWRPDHPLLAAAGRAGLDVYSEPELAWRMRGPGAAPWLAVTGTNGKTTTVTMLASMLRAAGLRTAAVGNIGTPLLTAALDPGYDVLAVELSSFQLHWSRTLAPRVGVVLNLADDHLDWHGGFDAYGSAKTGVWRGNTVAVGNADDERVSRLLGSTGAPRVVSFTLGIPQAGELGVVEDLLVDRTFGPGGPANAVELGTVGEVRPSGSHNVANALAAAALARAYGVPADAVRAGLTAYTPEPHRNAPVAEIDGVTYVNDSKATNPHAALASLLSYERVVWVAGGLFKGVDVDDLVRAAADRLAGVVLLGAERAAVAEALARHAPNVPVTDVAATDDGAMVQVVDAAARLAVPGDVVLLAPAAASMDMFRSYAHRGESFAVAVAARAGSV
ncbi:MAG TPA: UDP-N-acetylmuramoyl-L-alanine--D-glutamate ligase [Mycobacteriales bacterium]|nr:UDP-N-acetylmuramoyl-L-alanine--D-glutamate ligase [Mycobacteriales bacterium]